MSELIVVEVEGENRIDSRLVAKLLGIEHESFMKTVHKHQDSLAKLGGLVLNTGYKSKHKRGKPHLYVMLNENQWVFMATKVKNTEKGVAVKIALIKAFSKSRKSQEHLEVPEELFCFQDKQKKLREVDIQRSYAEYLLSQGENVRREVKCSAGAADIVTDDAIYEIKNAFTSKCIFEAIGQVLIYRFCINPNARAVIVGRYTEDVDKLRSIVESMGIEIIIWDDQIEKPKKRGWLR